MGKIKEILINNFSGGMAVDLRSKDISQFGFASHFDIFTYPHKLQPQNGATAGETKSYDIVKFVNASRGGTGALFGFGKYTGSRPIVFYWNGSSWVEYANNSSASGTRSEVVFFHYKQYIYMFKDGSKLIRFDAYDSSAAFDDDLMTTWSKSAITYTNLAQPVHHQSDDIAYFFIDNKVYSLDAPDDGGAGWALALTLPSNLKIIGGTAYGTYLAIACVSLGADTTSGVKSVVYLWDRDASLATLADVIDFGLGEIKYIGVLNNILTAVMLSIEDRLITVKQHSGKFGREVSRLIIDNQATFTQSSQVVDNKLFFPMGAPLDGDARLGIWAIDSLGRLSLDTVIDGATSYQGIYYTGERWFVAHSDDGSVEIGNTDGTDAPSSVYESLIIGDPHQKHKLLSVAVMYEAGTGSGGIGSTILKYRSDAEGTWGADDWTTIYSNTVAIPTTEVFHQSVNIEADGSELPEFREIQFQVSTKKHFLGLYIKYEEIDSNPG